VVAGIPRRLAHTVATASTTGNTMQLETAVETEALWQGLADFRRKTMRIIGIFIVMMATASTAFAHGGGLDKNGCHNDRKKGGYHCH
jgi:hypothetical protein